MNLKRITYHILIIFIITFSLDISLVNAQLQELNINPINTDELPPLIREHPEMAIVIIRSTMDDLSFSTNMEIVDERSEPGAGQYILIIPSGARQIIRINAPDYIQGRIRVPSLEPKRAIYYSVEPVAQASDETIPMVFQTDPVGATVEIDGETVDISRSVPLSPGNHLVKVSSDGYRTIEQEIEADRGSTLVTFTLEQVERVPVTIRTVPANATVSINGITVGQSGEDGIFQEFRFPGNYNVTVSSLNFVNEQRVIEVADQPDTTNEFLFELQPSSATLTLSIDPPDARVRIDNREQSYSEPVELSQGVYRLQVDREGYQPYEENIRLSANENRELNIELEQLTGRFFFTVSPSSASVELLDKNGDITDSWSGIYRSDLPAGTYQLIIKADGYREKSESVVIRHNETIEKRIDLEQLEEPEPIAGNDDISDDPEPIPTGNGTADDIQTDDSPIINQPSKGTALTASILFPGAGHIYSKRSRGYFYLIAGVATAGLAVYSYTDEQSVADSYDAAFDNYMSARNFSDAVTYRNEAEQLFDERVSAINRLNLSLIAFSAIHVIQLIDILSTTPPQGFRSDTQEGFQASVTPTGIRLRYGFN